MAFVRRNLPAVEALEPRALCADLTGLAAAGVAVAAEDPSLAAWFRADTLAAAPGSLLSAWPDATGRGFTATQSDPAKRPRFQPGVLNGRAAVQFDAASSTSLSFPRPVSGDFTIVVVFGASRGAGRGDQWYQGAGIVDGEVTGVTNDFGLSLNADGRVLAGIGGPDVTAGSGLGFDDGRAHVATFTRSAATREVTLHVDGRLFRTAVGGTQALTAPPRLTIGATRTGAQYFTGHVGEVRIYSAVLPDATRAAVESDLSAAFNVAPLPGLGDWYTNPVIRSNFPDPGAVYANGYYYAYATNGNGRNVQTARSTDLVHWTTLPDAMPSLPSWAQAGRTWAPDVAVTATGQYNLYYTAWSRATGRQAIGVATSSSPAGPFVSAGAAPLVAQFDRGGAIDPSVFTAADGAQYLLWKNDGNAVGQDTWIYVQRLAPDGRSLVGSPAPLIHQDQPWEGSLVEAPVLWTRGGKYYLFYSANAYGNGSYATGYAVADSLLGPYAKAAGPLMASAGAVVGPGGPEVVVGPDGDTHLLYHSWENNLAYRALSVDELRWEGGVPVVRGPSRVTQPEPMRPRVVGRHVFYNDSAFDGRDPAARHTDDAAVAPNKRPMVSGGDGPEFDHITSYDRGINGVMIDVAYLPREYTPSAADFDFRHGPAPLVAGMPVAPAPASITLRRGAGVNGSDRLTFVWTDATAVRNEWLKVTMLASDRTALASYDAFTFGNVVGKTGDHSPEGWSATAIDFHRTRAALSRGFAPITSPFDFNRDGRINATDLYLARAAQSAPTATAVTIQSVPPAPRTPPRRRTAWEEIAV